MRAKLSCLGLFGTIGALGLIGCGPNAPDIDSMSPANIDSEQDARLFVTLSAPYMSVNGLLLASSVLEEEEPCPVVTETSSGVFEMEGGCTTSDGSVWEGTAYYAVDDEGVGELEFDGFGVTSMVDCSDGTEAESRARYYGTRVGTDAGNGTVSFDLDIWGVWNGPAVDYDNPSATGYDCSQDVTWESAWEYSGSYGPAPGSTSGTLYEGSGRYATTPLGRVDLETVGEIVDDSICDREAAAGVTTITGADTLTVTYDGATDCSADSTVVWALNGVEQGELEGVYCALRRPGGGPAPHSLLLVALAIAGLASRRRSSSLRPLRGS